MMSFSVIKMKFLALYLLTEKTLVDGNKPDSVRAQALIFIPTTETGNN